MCNLNIILGPNSQLSIKSCMYLYYTVCLFCRIICLICYLFVYLFMDLLILSFIYGGFLICSSGFIYLLIRYYSFTYTTKNPYFWRKFFTFKPAVLARSIDFNNMIINYLLSLRFIFGNNFAVSFEMYYFCLYFKHSFVENIFKHKLNCDWIGLLGWRIRHKRRGHDEEVPIRKKIAVWKKNPGLAALQRAENVNMLTSIKKNQKRLTRYSPPAAISAAFL